MPSPQPFSLRVPDEALDDLRQRLARTRFPDEAPAERWAHGTDVDWLRDLVAYWQDGFDWRAAEARLNALPNYTLPIAGIDLHFIHAPGRGPNPVPLLMSHGWPGSVFEFLAIIERLTDPARFGGDPADAFTVVAPSLPGYGLSYRPGQERFGINRIADVFAELMGALGHERFVAQGGDWGASITARLGHAHPDRLLGVHFNMVPVGRDPSLLSENASDEEARYLSELKAWTEEETGYQKIQGTKPQTLAFGLSDSPGGLAAWIGEKYHRWSDHDGDVFSAISRDEALANISLYWFTGAIGSSFWPYYARVHGERPVPAGETIAVPAGFAAFPREILRPPRSVVERVFTDIRRWTAMERGGHFAAWEQPDALAREIAAFARPLRP